MPYHDLPFPAINPEEDEHTQNESRARYYLNIWNNERHHGLPALTRTYLTEHHASPRHNRFAFGNNLYKSLNALIFALIIFYNGINTSSEEDAHAESNDNTIVNLLIAGAVNEGIACLISGIATYKIPHRWERWMGYISTASTGLTSASVITSTALLVTQENPLATDVILFFGFLQNVGVSFWRLVYGIRSINQLRHEAILEIYNGDGTPQSELIIRDLLKQARRFERLYTHNFFQRIGNLIIDLLLPAAILFGMLFSGNEYSYFAFGMCFITFATALANMFMAGFRLAGQYHLDRTQTAQQHPSLDNLRSPASSGFFGSPTASISLVRSFDSIAWSDGSRSLSLPLNESARSMSLVSSPSNIGIFGGSPRLTNLVGRIISIEEVEDVEEANNQIANPTLSESDSPIVISII